MKIIGWIVGIFVLLVLHFSTEFIGNIFESKSIISFDEPITITHWYGRVSEDEETDSIVTDYGISSMVLSVSIAMWAGIATYKKSLSAGLIYKEKQALIYIIYGSTVISIFTLIINLLNHQIDNSILLYIVRIFKILLSITICVYFYRKYSNKIK